MGDNSQHAAVVLACRVAALAMGVRVKQLSWFDSSSKNIVSIQSVPAPKAA